MKWDRSDLHLYKQNALKSPLALVLTLHYVLLVLENREIKTSEKSAVCGSENGRWPRNMLFIIKKIRILYPIKVAARQENHVDELYLSSNSLQSSSIKTLKFFLHHFL